MSSTKRQPQRTCVACRQVKSQRELVRLVCSETDIEVDARNKRPGRGAYLCLQRECWEQGVKEGKLEYALKTTLTPETREKLLKCWEDLEKGLNSGR